MSDDFLTCAICQHAKREAIETSLQAGTHVAVVATQFRVKKADLLVHREHAKTQVTRHLHVPQRPKVSIRMIEAKDAPDVFTDAEPFQGLASIKMDRLAIQGPPVDPILRVKHYVTEAARIWRDEVAHDRRSPERLQMILEEAFADPNMGL